MSKFKKCLKCAVQNTKAKKTVSAHNLFSEKSHKLTAVWLHKLVALVAKRTFRFRNNAAINRATLGASGDQRERI
jgi:hypothetical protein